LEGLEPLQRQLRGVFACVLDVVAVIPVASGVNLSIDFDGARPGSAASTSIGSSVKDWRPKAICGAIGFEAHLPIPWGLVAVVRNVVGNVVGHFDG